MTLNLLSFLYVVLIIDWLHENTYETDIMQLFISILMTTGMATHPACIPAPRPLTAGISSSISHNSDQLTDNGRVLMTS